MVKTKLTLYIDTRTIARYKKFCRREGFIVSQRLENFMKHDMVKKFWEIKV